LESGREMKLISIYAANKKIGSMVISNFLDSINTNYKIEDLFTGDILSGLP
jgi:hypothetical protein